MLEEIKEIIKQANKDYIILYDTKKGMNKDSFELKENARFAYIEEFVKGTYDIKNSFFNKTTRMQIYFSCIINYQNSTAQTRENIRKNIENEIVRGFISKYNASPNFFPVSKWNFYTVLPQFSNKEVSVMLEFDCKETNNC